MPEHEQIANAAIKILRLPLSVETHGQEGAARRADTVILRTVQYLVQIPGTVCSLPQID
jgi:hypothetical protein